MTAGRIICVELDAYLVQGTSDGVARRLTNRCVELRGSDAGEESDDGGLGEHLVGII